MEKNYQLVTTVYGTAESESIRLFLEAAGIEVLLAQESAGKSSFPVTVGKLAQVKIFVRGDQAEEASTLIKEMEDGQFLNSPDIEEDEA